MIPFVRKFEFEYGKAQTLSPLVTRVMANNPGPFTFTGTGTFIIGKNEAAIIDPGPALPQHETALHDALKGKTLTHIFLTHHHADHSPLAAPLAAHYGCKIYGLSPKTAAQNGGPILEAGEDRTFAPDVQISGGDTFTRDGWSLEALHTPGHTSNHICFALKEENTLFSGDHIMGWATSVVLPPDGHMGDYLTSLKTVAARRFGIIRPTHGPAITAPAPFLKAYIAHRYERENQIGMALARGHTNISTMVETIYVDLDKRLFPAASLSVLSHLTYLCETGRVECNGPIGLGGHYTLI